MFLIKKKTEQKLTLKGKVACDSALLPLLKDIIAKLFLCHYHCLQDKNVSLHITKSIRRKYIYKRENKCTHLTIFLRKARRSVISTSNCCYCYFQYLSLSKNDTGKTVYSEVKKGFSCILDRNRCSNTR